MVVADAVAALADSSGFCGLEIDFLHTATIHQTCFSEFASRVCFKYNTIRTTHRIFHHLHHSHHCNHHQHTHMHHKHVQQRYCVGNMSYLLPNQLNVDLQKKQSPSKRTGTRIIFEQPFINAFCERGQTMCFIKNAK